MTTAYARPQSISAIIARRQAVYRPGSLIHRSGKTYRVIKFLQSRQLVWCQDIQSKEGRYLAAL